MTTLTPDDITDEMVLRFMNTYDRLNDGSKDAPGLNHFTAARTSLTRSALAAALAEPPARPEGAEELDALVDASIRGCSDITSPETVRAISDGLAESGVRVTGKDN